MKKLMTLALLALVALGAQAEEKKDSVNNKPVFTTIKENPITPRSSKSLWPSINSQIGKSDNK